MKGIRIKKIRVLKQKILDGLFTKDWLRYSGNVLLEKVAIEKESGVMRVYQFSETHPHKTSIVAVFRTKKLKDEAPLF